MNNKPLNLWIRARALLGLALLAGITASAQPTVATLGGGSPLVTPKYQGYRDGTTISQALFHTPAGLALDSTGQYLYVADRDNSAIRYLDLTAGLTWTFGVTFTNLINKPIAVAVDASDYVYVLNRGNGTNGSVVTFDNWGDAVVTNAVGLTNASGMSLDTVGNIYLTIQSNKLIRIAAFSSNRTTIAIITNAGTSLQGLVVKHNGLVAACDSGNNGIWLVDPSTTNSYNKLAGFHGTGDFTTNGNNTASSTKAMFNQPMGVAEAGDGTLIVTDYGNNRVKAVLTSGVVTNLYGVTSQYWGGNYPGWYDGAMKIPDYAPPGTPSSPGVNAQSRLPFGVVFAPNGNIYTSEDYYHLIRKLTGAGLPQPPPPPPQVPIPQIGWVDFPATSLPVAYASVFHPVSSFIFNNDAPIVIEGTAGSQTYYTYSNTPSIYSFPNPTSSSYSAPVGYQDGMTAGQVNNYAVAGIAPYVAIKAIGEKNDGSPNSAVASAVFQYVTGNPSINGNNAALFTISDITANAHLYYTLDGSDPSSTNANAVDLGTVSTSVDTTTNLWTISLNITSNTLFKVRAFHNNYQPSGIVSNLFTTTAFQPNTITFGTVVGEPHSSFVARPGQFYYAPVTLQLVPGFGKMYSLQFNVTVTNGLVNTNTSLLPPAIQNGAGIDFFSMLMSSVQPNEGQYYPPSDGNWYLGIPPLVYVDTNSASSAQFVNTNNNLLGVGWLYRSGFKYNLTNLITGKPLLDFDTAKQDLISFSITHDTLFTKAKGLVVVGAYSFQVPASASYGDKYFIQLGSPSATADGVGAPGAGIYIAPPPASQAVTVGSPAYIVGDVAPFHWFNAGDFGDTNLDNSDVMQVFQSAIFEVNMPPANSDLNLAMDSAGGFGVWDRVNNYYTNAGTATFAQQQAMWDGNDLSINSSAFGDGKLDINDVYVTFRRSLDPSLTWFKRYWTNGMIVAVTNANYAFNTNVPHLLASKALSTVTAKAATKPDYRQSLINFSAGDAVVTAGQTIQIPINAQILGGYPLRVLGLNLTVVPLDGSPALTQPVTFTPATGLGNPSITSSKGTENYAAAWLDSSIGGLAGNTQIGTLTVAIPANATSGSAYAVHFDKASGSPNGLAVFPKQTLTGLITLSSRTNSSYGDRIPDSWRLRWFGTANNYLSVSNACPTGDGINNWMKYVAGIDPNTANNFPSVNARTPVPSGSTSAIHWPTVSGKQYAIERSSSLFPGTWSAIATNTGTGTDMEFDDNSGGTVKFYRVRILP